MDRVTLTPDALTLSFCVVVDVVYSLFSLGITCLKEVLKVWLGRVWVADYLWAYTPGLNPFFLCIKHQ